jgi:hypothetical protein
LAIISAAIRSRRLGLGVLAVVLADKMRGEAKTGRERLDEFALARSRRSVNQNIRGGGNALASMGDHARGKIAQFAKMGEIVPAQRSGRRFAEKESPDLRRGETLPRKHRADEVGNTEVVVVILFDQAESRQNPFLGQVPSFDLRIENGAQFGVVELF